MPCESLLSVVITTDRSCTDRNCLGMQAVGPVAVTSLLLGNGLSDTIDGPIQANPNQPVNQKAQDEYNHAAIEVNKPHSQPPHLHLDICVDNFKL